MAKTKAKRRNPARRYERGPYRRRETVYLTERQRLQFDDRLRWSVHGEDRLLGLIRRGTEELGVEFSEHDDCAVRGLLRLLRSLPPAAAQHPALRDALALMGAGAPEAASEGS